MRRGCRFGPWPIRTVRDPLVRLLALGLACAAPGLAAAAPDCPGPALQPQSLARDVWLLEANGGEASLLNGGFVSNLVLVRTASGAWLSGTGPSAAFGEALRCGSRALLGREVSDVINPWARAELVLGAPAFAKARVHGLDSVGAQMQQQCTACIRTLRESTGPTSVAAAASEAPYRLPETALKGDRGRIGPFQWWRRARAAQADVLVLYHRESRLWIAPGLFWGRAVPDLRGAGLPETIASLHWLHERMGAASAWWESRAARAARGGADPTRLRARPAAARRRGAALGQLRGLGAIRGTAAVRGWAHSRYGIRSTASVPGARRRRRGCGKGTSRHDDHQPRFEQGPALRGWCNNGSYES